MTNIIITNQNVIPQLSYQYYIYEFLCAHDSLCNIYGDMKTNILSLTVNPTTDEVIPYTSETTECEIVRLLNAVTCESGQEESVRNLIL